MGYIYKSMYSIMSIGFCQIIWLLFEILIWARIARIIEQFAVTNWMPIHAGHKRDTEMGVAHLIICTTILKHLAGPHIFIFSWGEMKFGQKNQQKKNCSSYNFLLSIYSLKILFYMKSLIKRIPLWLQ